MTSIIYIGMDVHTTNFTLCCYTMDSEREFATVQTKPDYHEILKYMERIRKQRGEDCRFVCGYEAGCLGYSLHNQLRAHGVDCIILAPSTMPQEKGKRIKNRSQRRCEDCQVSGIPSVQPGLCSGCRR